MNSLWLQYIAALAAQSSASLLERLPKADFHGAILCVVCATNVCTVGCKGIVAKESTCTFLLVGSDNVARQVPKRGSIFEMLYDSTKYLLYGSQLCFDAAERSVKKFKPKIKLF